MKGFHQYVAPGKRRDWLRLRPPLKPEREIDIIRTLVHEGMHGFARIQLTGIFENYHTDSTQWFADTESTLKLSRAERLDNTDSHAVFVMLVGFPPPDGLDLRERVRLTRGEKLEILQNPRGVISLVQPPAHPTFKLLFVDSLSSENADWRLVDATGHEYELSIADRKRSLQGVTIPQVTRNLLRERRVSRATLSARCQLVEAGERIVTRELEFQSS